VQILFVLKLVALPEREPGERKPISRDVNGHGKFTVESGIFVNFNALLVIFNHVLSNLDL
jgi:hypothetical protein